jgi:hypothetical protein
MVYRTVSLLSYLYCTPTMYLFSVHQVKFIKGTWTRDCFLLAYAILRSIPNKLGGVVAFAFSSHIVAQERGKKNLWGLKKIKLRKIKRLLKIIFFYLK